MSKYVKARCLDARYYPEKKSIALILEDWETHRPIKTAQIPASAFSFNEKDVDQEMYRTAELYKKFKYPIKVIEADPDPAPITSDIELPEPWMIPFFGSKQ